MKKYHTEDEVRHVLRDMISYDYRQKDMAKDAKVSNSFVSEVLRGKRKVNGALARVAGFLREVEVFKWNDKYVERVIFRRLEG